MYPLESQKILSMQASDIMEIKEDLKKLINIAFLGISSDQASEQANFTIGQLQNAHENIVFGEENGSIIDGLTSAHQVLEFLRIDDTPQLRTAIRRRFCEDAEPIDELNTQIVHLINRISNLILTLKVQEPPKANDFSSLVIGDYFSQPLAPHRVIDSYCKADEIEEDDFEII